MSNVVDIRLYGILDTVILKDKNIVDLAVQSVEGGVTILQLRDKVGDNRSSMQLAREIHRKINGKVPIVINDRVDIALSANVDGVHVGLDDMPAEIARNILGEKAIIGVSLKSKDDLNILRSKVDYGFFGAIFSTSSKEIDRSPIGISNFSQLRIEAAKVSPLPIGVIGGINLKNCRDCIMAGADGIATISALYLSKNVKETAKNFLNIIDEALAIRKKKNK